MSNRQDNGLSKSDIQRREKSMIDEYVSRNFGEKKFDINMTDRSTEVNVYLNYDYMG